jgi:hypothetical protein
MPNTYSWDVEDMLVNPLESSLVNVVKKVHCYLIADDGAGGTVKQLLVATLPPPDPGTFIPYASLTEATVVGWCQAVFGTPSIDAWKAVLDDRLIQESYDFLANPWE